MRNQRVGIAVLIGALVAVGGATVAQADRATASAPSPRIRVVAADGSPVAGASVRWAPTLRRRLSVAPTPGHGRAAWSHLDDSWIHRLLERGSTMVTDERGEVQLPPGTERAFVLAVHGGAVALDGVEFGGDWSPDETTPLDLFFERLRSHPIDEPLELVLRPARDLEVRVRNPDGVPCADVDLVLAMEGGKTVAGVPPPYAHCRTGADGRAVFPFAEAMLADLHEGSEVLVTAIGPFVPLVVHGFSPATFPVEPIELTLPATGRVVVRVLDAAGEPVRDFPGLDVRAWGIKDRVPAARRPLAVAHLDLPGGVAVLPFVGLGLDLEAAVRDYKHATRFRGPETPGAAVEAVIQIEEPRPAVYGRALDEAGAPLAAVALGIDFGDLGYVSGMTELDGSFVLPIPEGAWGAGPTTLWINARFVRRGALHEVASVPPKGVLAIGDLRLAATRFVAAGVIVDAAGRPQPGLHVEVILRGEDGRWRPPDERLLATSDEQGRFEIPAGIAPVTGPIALFVRQRALLEMNAGTTNVRLVVLGTGSLVGRILLPDGLQRNAVVLYLVGPDGPLRGGSLVLLGDDGRLERDRLAEGRYDLHLLPVAKRSREVPQPLVAGIVVKPDEVNRDARLDPLDLRASLPTLTLTLVGRDGAPVPDARVFAPKPSRLPSWIGTSTPDGRVVLHRLAEPFDVLVGGIDIRPTMVTGLTGDARARALPALDLVVTLAPTPRPPQGRITAWLRPDRVFDAEPRLAEVRDHLFEPNVGRYQFGDVKDGVVHLRPPLPGRWRLRFELNTGARMRLFETEVEVLDQEEPTRRRIEVPPEARAALGIAPR